MIILLIKLALLVSPNSHGLHVLHFYQKSQGYDQRRLLYITSVGAEEQDDTIYYSNILFDSGTFHVFEVTLGAISQFMPLFTVF